MSRVTFLTDKDLPGMYSKFASAIEQTVEGDVVSINDSEAIPAFSVTTTIEPVREGEGTPSPDNVMPLSVRATASLWHEAAYDEAAEAMLTINLPDGVYGAKLDWVTGVLTITHKNVMLDGSSVSWTYGSKNIATRIKDRATNATLYCDRYVVNAKNGPTSLAAGEMCLGLNYNNVCFGNPGNAITIDEWKALRDEDPIQLVYELAEVTTVQLTPQQIEMLKGGNALWSDSGSTSLTYVANTKMYIDNAIAALAASVINV